MRGLQGGNRIVEMVEHSVRQLKELDPNEATLHVGGHGSKTGGGGVMRLDGLCPICRQDPLAHPIFSFVRWDFERQMLCQAFLRPPSVVAQRLPSLLFTPPCKQPYQWKRPNYSVQLGYFERFCVLLGRDGTPVRWAGKTLGIYVASRCSG